MKVLAIGAHPDDIEFGCGGTLAKHVKDDDEVHLFVFTLGEGDKLTLPEIRMEEAKVSAGKLGASIYFAGYTVYDVYDVKHELINVTEKIIEEVNPKRVYSLYPHDTHQTHNVIAKCSIIATRYIDEVFLYELPSSFNFKPTIFVDITDTMETKLKCLQAYKSQKDKQCLHPEVTKSRGTYWFSKAYFKNKLGYAEPFSLHRMKLCGRRV